MTSIIKVNNLQNQCGANTINKCGTTITLGASGDTIALASGASQTGFGRTGTVDWNTTPKTAIFTAVSGEGYFCNTSGGAFTLTLPSSPSAGDIVGLKDYNGNFSTANLTIGRGGSNLSGSGADKILDTNNLSLTLVYVDATEGWVPIEEGTGFIGENFITATGGTITTSGNCKIHTFTGPGTFTVCSVASCAANNIMSHVVVAGGGKVAFRDNGGEYIYSVSDNVLGLVAGSEIDLTATTIDINGLVDISGNLTVGGDLDVNGTTTTINTANSYITYKFMIMASGSTSDTDGGIIVQNAAGSGYALGYDSGVDRWAFDADLAHNATALGPDAYVGVVQVATTDGDSLADPIYGGGVNGVGTIYVDTDDSEIWIYA